MNKKVSPPVHVPSSHRSRLTRPGAQQLSVDVHLQPPSPESSPSPSPRSSPSPSPKSVSPYRSKTFSYRTMSDSVSEDDRMLSPKDGEQRQRRSSKPKRQKLKQNSIHFDEEFKKSPRLIQRRLTIDATAYEETKKEGVEGSAGGGMKEGCSGGDAATAGDKGSDAFYDAVSESLRDRDRGMLDKDSHIKKGNKNDDGHSVELLVVTAKPNLGRPFFEPNGEKSLTLTPEIRAKDSREGLRLSRIRSDGDFGEVGAAGGQGLSVIGQGHKKLQNSRSESDSKEIDVEKLCQGLQNNNCFSKHMDTSNRGCDSDSDKGKRSHLAKLHNRQKAVESVDYQKVSLEEFEGDRNPSPRNIRRGMSDNSGLGCKDATHVRSKRAYTCDPLPRMEEEIFKSRSAAAKSGAEQFTFEEKSGLRPNLSAEDLPSVSSEGPTASFLQEVEAITKRERGRRLSIEAPGRLENLTEALTPELRKKHHVLGRSNTAGNLFRHRKKDGAGESELSNGSPPKPIRWHFTDPHHKKRIFNQIFSQITKPNMSYAVADRKKSVDQKTLKKKTPRSPLPQKKLGDGSAGIQRGRGASNVSNDSYLSGSMLDAHHLSEDDGAMDGYHTNGGSLDNMLDDVDNQTSDPMRAKNAIEHLQQKIARTRELIKMEQISKEENVNEYLKLSLNADKQQVQRIKTVFEKKNIKSTQNITQLQKKLENYQKKVRDVEQYGVMSHKQPREVLRDMGQGLKGVGANIRDGITGFSGGVVDNIKGATETIVSKPKEFASLIKNKFGSADNIRNLPGYIESNIGSSTFYVESMEESQASTDEGERSHHGSGTLPARDHHSHPPLTPIGYGIAETPRIYYSGSHGSAPLPASRGTKLCYTLPHSFKYGSDDEASSVTSGSGPSAGAQSSPHPQAQMMYAPQINLDPIINEMQENREVQMKLRETVESLKTQMSTDYAFFKTSLEEERYRYERLEEQINDLIELHQHEMTNLKQELGSMEEKMEYQLEERTRDISEMLESCQTRITKMELQQQQQQLISMEGVENANARALITKLINVVLAILAVILVLVSTIANMLSPFITTRNFIGNQINKIFHRKNRRHPRQSSAGIRILSTALLILAIVLSYQNWPSIEGAVQTVIEFFNRTFFSQ
ncbi:transmembrane and coiled-coil domains protein 1-like isoform X5 [Lineus longissimus]|uniref:transmembrane and coiled-coil domains protein 1-like isoform X5 n=1 Tax=Lineus longissimus TaxID=88925 RepID=UPI00315CF8C0